MALRAALIGCGRIGSLLEEDPLRGKPASHMGGVFKAGFAPESLSVCDINEERLSRCAERWGISSAYRDYRDLLRAERPDIVIVATWTHTHVEIAKAAVEAGVRGIVMEKPVSVDLAEAWAFIRDCRAAGVVLAVNHERRWDPLYRFARRVVDSGELGELSAVHGCVLTSSAPRGDWREVLKTAGGGPLLHDGTHLTDMIRFLAGDAETVSGSIIRKDGSFATETGASALITMKSGIPVFLHAGGSRDYFHFELDLQFERGRLKVGNGVRELYGSESSARYTGFRDLVRREFPVLKRDSDPFSGAIREVVEGLEAGVPGISTGEDGYRALEMIFAIYRSAALGGVPVRLPVNPEDFAVHPLAEMFSREEPPGD